MQKENAHQEAFQQDRKEKGQASVEFLIIFAAFLSTIVALSVYWHVAHDGALLQKAINAASHGLAQGVSISFMQDFIAF
ncbi:MAG: TadE/TadG family type IV pilus assembly protein [Atopobiaceae bacterium]|jgi:hypothetical protein